MCSLTLSKTVVTNSPVTSSSHGCLGLVALDSDTPVPVPVPALVPATAPRARSATVPVPVSESCIQDAAMSAAMHTRHPNPQHLFFFSCGNARSLPGYSAGLPLALSMRNSPATTSFTIQMVSSRLCLLRFATPGLLAFCVCGLACSTSVLRSLAESRLDWFLLPDFRLSTRAAPPGRYPCVDRVYPSGCR